MEHIGDSIERPHYKISYAQNFEDLILFGILRDVQKGFYVDVGANHPEHDSVTKIFYDKGWSGINIEPNSILYKELCIQRPRDINLNIGVASKSGQLSFRSFDSLNGLSTFSIDHKNIVQTINPQEKYSDTMVNVQNLQSIFSSYKENRDIHFLKIDVEGFEEEVLLGNDWNVFRPWIICIEQSHNPDISVKIDTMLTSIQYKKVFFDGINNYFIAEEKISLWNNFSYSRDVVQNGLVINYFFIKYIESLHERILFLQNSLVDKKDNTLNIIQDVHIQEVEDKLDIEDVSTASKKK